MNSTTAPPVRTRLPWRADLLTALTGLALESVAAFSVIVFAGLTGGAAPHRSHGGAARADQILILGFGLLIFFALLIALLLRGKAPITAAVHLLLSAALLLAALVLPSAEPGPSAPSSTRTAHAPRIDDRTSHENRFH